MNKVSKDSLFDLYYNKGHTMHEISCILGISQGSVFNYIKKYNIQVPTMKEIFLRKKENGWTYPSSARLRISNAHKNKIVSLDTREKMSERKKIHGIGHSKKRDDGYIALYYPDYESSNKEGYVMEHVYIMEQHIGRKLKEDEVVHHINHNRADNRIENLKLMTFKEHASMHMKERWAKKKGGMTYQ